MHLKNLTLKGFKSFADTARIDFEPGVTVVVGGKPSGGSGTRRGVSVVVVESSTSAGSGRRMKSCASW